MVVIAGNGNVRCLHFRKQRGHQIRTGDDNLRPEDHQALIPDVQRCELLVLHPARAGGFQQGVALPQHTVVVGEHAGEPRRTQHQQLVQETAPTRGFSADQREVFRGEQDAGEVPGELAHLDGRAIDLRPVGRGAVELQLHEHAPLVVSQLRSNDGGVATLPDHGVVGRHPVRAERAEVTQRLHEVRLALAVAADDEIRALGESDIRARVITKIGEVQPIDDHGNVLSVTGAVSRLS